MTSRKGALEIIGQNVQNMIQNFGRRSDIEITFENVTVDSLAAFSELQRRYHCILPGQETFFIWEKNGDRRNLLYTVNVEGDSYLTAAQELIDLVARKF